MPNWQPTSSGNNKLTNPSPKWIHTMLEEFILSLFRLMGEQVSGQKKLAQLQVSWAAKTIQTNFRILLGRYYLHTRQLLPPQSFFHTPLEYLFPSVNSIITHPRCLCCWNLIRALISSTPSTHVPNSSITGLVYKPAKATRSISKSRCSKKPAHTIPHQICKLQGSASNKKFVPQ